MERVSSPSSLCHHCEMSTSAVESIPQQVPETVTEMLPATNANRNVTEATTVPSIPDNSEVVISNNSNPNSPSNQTNNSDDENMASSSSHRKGRWTLDEKVLFLHGLTTYGKGRWKKISIFLPRRSLVQIKSHAQKVLKRQAAGENVFRRLEEHAFRLEALIETAFADQGIRADHMIPQPSAAKKRKPRSATAAATAAAAVAANKKNTAPQQQQQQPYSFYSQGTTATRHGFGGYHSHPSSPPPPPSHAPYTQACYPPPQGHAYSPALEAPHGNAAAPHADNSRAFSPHSLEGAHAHALDGFSTYPLDAHAPLQSSHGYAPLPDAPRAHSPPMNASGPPSKSTVNMEGGGSTAVAAAALCQLSCAEMEISDTNPVTATNNDTAGESTQIESGRNGSHDSDNSSSSGSLDGASSSLPSRQVFFPVDLDPALTERPRNVVSP